MNSITMDSSFRLDSNDKLFEKVMSCPLKRKLVMDLIASEKDNIEEYKKNLATQKFLANTSDSASSPLRKVQKKYACESPTALLRRRALEQQNSAEIQSPSTKQTFRSSLPAVSNKILTDVVAFVDVKSNNCDRSAGVKALLRSMGATIEEIFSKEVTHVIFKDGSFSTYQKANLMKVHLVSVLWIEACRNRGAKVAEKKFPALGTDVYDHNVSALCSQLQKDYEEIIREEYCRSVETGTPLPSTRALIHKRRTNMTPTVVNSSFMEKHLSQEYQTSQDTEVAEIFNEGRNDRNAVSPDQSQMTPGISDVEPFISGKIIEKNFVGFPDKRDMITDNQNIEGNKISIEDPNLPSEELSNTDNLQITREVDIISTESCSPKTPCEFYSKNTPKITRSRTNNIFNDESSCRRRTRSQSNKIDGNSLSVNNSIIDSTLTEKEPLLQVPTCISKKVDKRVETNISSEKGNNIVEKSSSTNMSSLQLSTNHSTNTNMSELLISSEITKNLSGFNSNNNSFSPVQSNVMNKLLELLDTSLQMSDNITKRSKKTIDWEIVFNENQRDDGSPEIDEIKLAGSLKGDNGVSDNQRLKTGKSKSETPQHEITQSGMSNTKTHKKTKSAEKSVCDPTKHSKTHSGSNKIRKDEISENVFDGNENEIGENRIELSKVDEIQKTSDPFSLPNSSERMRIRNGRKLYDPSDISHEHFHTNVRNNGPSSKNSNVFLKPGVILSHRAKRFVDKHNIDVEKILDRKVDQFHNSNQKLIKKKISTNESMKKHITGDDEDEQHRFSEQILAQKFSAECVDTNLQVVRSVSENKIIDSRNRVHADIETKKRNVINSVSSPKSDVKSTKRRCSVRLTRWSRKTSIDPKSRTEERGNQDDCSEHSQVKNDKPLMNIKKKDEIMGKNITGNAKEQHKTARRILGQRCPEKYGDINLYNEVITKKVDLIGTSPSPKTVKTKRLEVDKKCAKSRRSLRLTQHSKKANIDNDCRTEKEVDQNMLSENRRSTKEFQTKVESKKKKIKIDKLKQPSIVCTKMHKDEIQVFSQIVKKLGGFFIEDEITRKSTHLVAGEPRRTINMLRAIVSGCWIVSKEWLFQSLEAGKWLPEENFELTDFSPAVEQCRLQRQAFGASYSMDIFQDCGPMFISKGSTPRCSDLKELVILCKGQCTNNARYSKIVIGEVANYDGVVCVKEIWILDSITFNKRMPFRNYIISSSSTSGLAN